MSNKYKSLVSNTIIFGIGNFTVKLIYFFLMPIYTVSLTVDEFGLADLLNNSLQLLLPIFTMCITEAVFRFSLDKGIEHKTLLMNALRILLISSIIILCLAIVFFSFSAQIFWLYFALLYATESIRTLLSQFSRGIGKVKQYAANGIIGASILFIATFLYLKIFKLGINGYLFAFITSDIISILYLTYAVGLKKYFEIRRYDKFLMSKMLKYSLPLVPNMLSWWLTNISSRYIIAGFCGIGLSGLFSAASKLPALINVIASIFQLSWQYSAVKEYQEEKESLFYTQVLKYYSFIILLSGSIIILLIPFISKFLLKGAFYQAWTYTPLLVFAAVLGCYSVFFGTFYSAVKDNRGAMYSTIAGSIVNIIICFLLIPFIGVPGALIANVLSYVVIVIKRCKDIKKYVYIKLDRWKTILALIFLLSESIILTTDFAHALAFCSVFPVLILLIYINEIQALKNYLFLIVKNKSKR